MKKKKKERKRQEVLWPETHGKIAIVNTKIALSESAKVDQLSSLVFPPFLISQLSQVGTWWENLSDFGRKSLISALPSALPLETIGFTPTAIFKFATNISRMIRIV